VIPAYSSTAIDAHTVCSSARVSLELHLESEMGVKGEDAMVAFKTTSCELPIA
jgi:hypothetical protein